MKKISIVVLALLVFAGVAYAFQTELRDPRPGTYDWTSTDGTEGGTMEVREDGTLIFRDGEGEVLYELSKNPLHNGQPSPTNPEAEGQFSSDSHGHGKTMKFDVGTFLAVLDSILFDPDGEVYGKPDGIGTITTHPGGAKKSFTYDRHPTP